MALTIKSANKVYIGLAVIAGMAVIAAVGVILPRLQNPARGSKQEHSAVLKEDRAQLNRLKDAEELRKKGDLKDAEAIYRSVYEKLPNDLVLYELALTLRDEGRLQEAKRPWRQLLPPIANTAQR